MKMECLVVMIKGALKSIKPFYTVTEVIGLAGKVGVLSKHLQDVATGSQAGAWEPEETGQLHGGSGRHRPCPDMEYGFWSLE
jgi:hypothetical protein